MTEFQREERYIVIKRSRIEVGASPEVKQIRESYIRAQIPKNCLVDAVVVEADWPEYEAVWAMLEARMTGKAVKPAKELVGYANSSRLDEMDKVKAIVLSNEEDEHFNTPVYVNAQPPVSVPMSLRMPTEEDEDCFGKVLARETSGIWGLWQMQTLRMRPGEFTHWAPTGIVLPADQENSSASKFGNEKWSA